MLSMTLRANQIEPPRPGDAPQAWLLWVDGAGGFLILLTSEVSIGGPASEDQAMIGVQADLHRREAQVLRSGGEYFVQALDGAVSVEGQNRADQDRQPLALRSRDTFTLGRDTEVLFARPHPLSASARLSLAGHGRLRPHVDAVLLLDDTLIVGPTDDCHVRVPHAEGALVLVRQPRQWQLKPLLGPGIQSSGTQSSGQWQTLTPGQRFEQFGVAMTVEPL